MTAFLNDYKHNIKIYNNQILAGLFKKFPKDSILKLYLDIHNEITKKYIKTRYIEQITNKKVRYV